MSAGIVRATAFVALLSAAPAIAQEQDRMVAHEPPVQEPVAQMEGYVIGMPSGQRLPGSLVLLGTGVQSRTDVNGHFAFAGLAPGAYEVTIVAPGCQFAFTLVELDPWQTRRIGFTVEFKEEVHADEVRRRSSEGVLVTAAEIAEMRASDMSEVLRRAAPTMVGSAPGQPGTSGRLTMGRGNASTLATRAPALVVDGVRLGESNTRALNEIPPESVAFVEILKGAGGGWTYGSDGAGGVIAITTKNGVAADAPPMDPALCKIPDQPR